MTREELKGKQTPGVNYRKDLENHIGLGMTVHSDGIITAHCVKWDNEEESNAALYAEAHNVANRTGMWPEDLEQRVKELEEALRLFDEWASKCPPDKFILRAGEIVEHARAILNKKPA